MIINIIKNKKNNNLNRSKNSNQYNAVFIVGFKYSKKYSQYSR